MKLLHICIFFISFFCGISAISQETNDAATLPDSISYKDKYGLRVGLDISKPIRSVVDDHYRGIEVIGDYRFRRNYYLAAEIGNEDYDYTEPYLDLNTKGTYFKVGANYNAYDNWLGMQNELYVGLRYGFSTFTQTLNHYEIYSGDDYFDPDIRVVDEEFNGLTSSWVELQVGIKAEVLNNLFLGVHVQLKTTVSEDIPEGFDNLYIPGFHRTYEDSGIGVGWGYTISYMIPIIKKERKEKIPE